MSELNVTSELCERAIACYVTPMFDDNLARGNFGRRDGHLVIATTEPGNGVDDDKLAQPDEAFHDAVVIYEHSWGASRVEGNDFVLKAMQKAFGAWKLRKDYDRVLAEDPEFVEQHGLIRFPGAVIRDVTPPLLPKNKKRLPLLVAGYAGLWWWHDEMIVSATLGGIKAELAPQVHESQ